MNWKNKRKVEKGGIEALRSEFPVLTLPMMAMILGGNNKCVGEAFFLAAGFAGLNYVTQQGVEEMIIDYLVYGKHYKDRNAAIQGYANNGLTSTQTQGAFNYFCESLYIGCANTNSEEVKIAVFVTARDNQGKIIEGHAAIHKGDMTGGGGYWAENNSYGSNIVLSSDHLFFLSIPPNDPTSGGSSGGNGGSSGGSGG